MNENKSGEKSLFERSLDELTCDDLAPRIKRKSTKRQIAGKILWGGVALALFAVFLYSGNIALKDSIDFLVSELNLQNVQGAFSPITGMTEALLTLKTGANMYPIFDYDELKNGDVSYDDSFSPSPSFNPGTSPHPSNDNPPEPDPYLTRERLDAFTTRLKGLQRENNNGDIFAWIYIPGTNIDYPVVIGNKRDPDYYLDKGLNKKYNAAGSIYMDYRNDKNLLNNSFSVIYGHNIRQRGTMFNRLIEFKNPKTFDKYRYIYIFTETAALKYEIFSVYEAHGYESPSITISGYSDEEFLNKITEIQKKSLNERPGLVLSPKDRVLMLYTCANTTSVVANDFRCMVFGVLVDAVI